jgi:fucose 4-O-acetylase-like acetyltransferase
MLYFFSKFRYGFLFAIFLSLLIGYDSKVDDILSLSRTFFFFPFFMLGYLLEERHIFFFKKKKVRIVSIGILFVFIALIQLQVITTSDKELLLGKHSYNALGISWITRLFVYLVSTITSLSFLSLIPSKRYFFTSIGEKTLAIYLFHLFLVKAIHGSVLYDLIVDYQYFWILYFIPIFIVYLLSRKIFISISHFH